MKVFLHDTINMMMSFLCDINTSQLGPASGEIGKKIGGSLHPHVGTGIPTPMLFSTCISNKQHCEDYLHMSVLKTAKNTHLRGSWQV